MRGINISSKDGLFSGNVTVMIDDATKTETLIKKLSAVKGVKQVIRILNVRLKLAEVIT